MKNFIFTLLIFSAYSTCYAQIDKGYIGLSLGLATPVGKFASKQATVRTAGVANSGTVFDLSAGLKLGKHLGLAAMVKRQTNPMDDEALLNGFSSSSPGFSWAVESESYQMTVFMVGLYSAFPLSSRLTLDLRAVVGMSLNSYPDVFFDSMNDQNPVGDRIFVAQYAPNSSASAYGVGVNARYHLSKRLSTFAAFDFWATSPLWHIGVDSSYGRAYVRNKQPISSFNASFGIGYRFFGKNESKGNK